MTVAAAAAVSSTHSKPGTGVEKSNTGSWGAGHAPVLQSVAVDGLSEALWQEVEPLGLRVLIVEPGPFRTDWAGRSASETRPANEITDYADTAGTERAALRANAGREHGDPRRAAAAIVTVVDAESPPHRLLLGGLAYEMAMRKLDGLRAEFTAWEHLTRGAYFPVDAQVSLDAL